MVIEIERVSAYDMPRSERRCTTPGCAATPTWTLIDRDSPDVHGATVEGRNCCTPHIATTYLSLRGAHVVAQGFPVIPVYLRASQRRRRKLRSLPKLFAIDRGRNQLVEA